MVAAFAGGGRVEVELEFAGDAEDFALDAEDVVLKGAGAGVEGEEVEGPLAVAGETIEAVGEDDALLGDEALGPEVVEVEI